MHKYMRFTSHSQYDTASIAKQVAAHLNGGDVLLLTGDLGTGKTTFVKALAQTMGIQDDVTSPTFSLMNIYKINDHNLKIKNLVHIDTYRMNKADEFKEIGAEDYISDPENISVIEWPEKIKKIIKKSIKGRIIEITFTHGSKETRQITVSGVNVLDANIDTI